MGTSREDEHAPTADQRIPRRASLQFSFQFQAGTYSSMVVHEVVCDNVMRRGQVPLPEHWAHGLHASLAVPAILAEAQRETSVAEPHLEIQCHLLGFPKALASSAACPIQSDENFEIGQVVQLTLTTGTEAAYGGFLLCAHITGNFFVHSLLG